VGEWLRVGAAAEIEDGAIVAFEVGDRFVAVARVGDEFYAFDDICTHRACSLSEGDLDGTSVVCPCHAGEYDVRTGEVLSGPPPEPVASFPVRVAGGDLEIEV
jgi:naphthalene 1,2-dioxygenase system ferredoxin subunit